MPAWLVTLLSGGAGTALVAGLCGLIRHRMDLRLFRHTYDEGGAEDMIAASQAVHLRNPSRLARLRARLLRRSGRRPSRPVDDPDREPPPGVQDR